MSLLLGRPVPNAEAAQGRIGVLEGVPAMGLDGLGSAAYGPEAMLAVLVAAGGAGLHAAAPITLAILLLLAMLYVSYRQTIAAYPGNGGSYVVAKENLGIGAGLLAASALMLDYLLNVAVGISAGVGALISAVPALHAHTLALCLGILAVITLVNMRGTRESGLVFSAPTYLFVGSLAGILILGAVRIFMGGAHPVIAPPKLPAPREALGFWLLLRAFASGCTAMTGVEAVSNGVSAFREPRVRHAHGTLTAIVVTLGALLLGIGYLVREYGIAAMDQTQPGYQSVLSQLVGAVWGRGAVYDVVIGSVLAVLCLSANTSFVGFPRLCHMVAEDGFLPRPFAVPGRRLVYSVGVLFLAAGSGGLLILFGGITDPLIPLFAVGAFLSFTLSQAGMAVHWWHRVASGRGRADRVRLLVNGAGAVATGLALAVILLAKFLAGAWITVLAIPLTLLLLRAVRQYYDDIDRQVLQGRHRRVDLREHAPPLAIVPVGRWDLVARKAVEFAMRLSADVTALHVTTLQGPEADRWEAQLRAEWRDCVAAPAERAGIPVPKLELVQSPYRSVVAPLLRAIQSAQARVPNRPVVVVVPELIEARPWARIMHTRRAHRLRRRLLRYGGPDVALVSVPWQLQPVAPEHGLAEEESA